MQETQIFTTAGSITCVSQKGTLSSNQASFSSPQPKEEYLCNEPDMEGEAPICQEGRVLLLDISQVAPLLMFWHLCALYLGVTPGAAGAVKLGTVLYLDLDGDNNLVQSRQCTVCLTWWLQPQQVIVKQKCNLYPTSNSFQMLYCFLHQVQIHRCYYYVI